MVTYMEIAKKKKEKKKHRRGYILNKRHRYDGILIGFYSKALFR